MQCCFVIAGQETTVHATTPTHSTATETTGTGTQFVHTLNPSSEKNTTW